MAKEVAISPYPYDSIPTIHESIAARLLLRIGQRPDFSRVIDLPFEDNILTIVGLDNHRFDLIVADRRERFLAATLPTTLTHKPNLHGFKTRKELKASLKIKDHVIAEDTLRKMLLDRDTLPSSVLFVDDPDSGGLRRFNPNLDEEMGEIVRIAAHVLHVNVDLIL